MALHLMVQGLSLQPLSVNTALGFAPQGQMHQLCSVTEGSCTSLPEFNINRRTAEGAIHIYPAVMIMIRFAQLSSESALLTKFAHTNRDLTLLSMYKKTN